MKDAFQWSVMLMQSILLLQGEAEVMVVLWREASIQTISIGVPVKVSHRDHGDLHPMGSNCSHLATQKSKWGATSLLQQWQLQMQETHRQNLNPLLFHWSCRCGNILDSQWVMLMTFTLLTKKPQFASSAETTWQVILFKFPIDWGYNLLLHDVVNKCFKFDNVWYIANKSQILYCIKV